MNFDRFHDIIHSYAAILLKGGAHPKIVGERLGASILAITPATYNHALWGLQGRMIASNSNPASMGR